MKVFRCGKCQQPFKIDETKVASVRASVNCAACGSKNNILLGPFLIVQQREKKPLRLNLSVGSQTIGRASRQPQADLLIDDAYVSRRHAIIQVSLNGTDFHITIQDAGSLNGTYDRHKKRIGPGIQIKMDPSDYYIVGLTKISVRTK